MMYGKRVVEAAGKAVGTRGLHSTAVLASKNYKQRREAVLEKLELLAAAQENTQKATLAIYEELKKQTALLEAISQVKGMGFASSTAANAVGGAVVVGASHFVTNRSVRNSIAEFVKANTDKVITTTPMAEYHKKSSETANDFNVNDPFSDLGK